MHDAKTIANAFIKIAEERSWKLTNMQVQKLVYFAHGWYLALTGKPLISEDVKAWTFGPVIPCLYEELRHYKASPIDKPIESDCSGELRGKAIEQFLIRMYEKYGYLGGIQMSYLTHKPGTPWKETWDENPFGVIPNESIRSHFRELEAPQK